MIGETINTGNYESLRLDVGMESDVRTDETPEKALLRCQKFADAAMKKMVADAGKK